MHNKLARR